MIDFRYHVVSLAAALMALAIGIVLGSGPLRTALVSSLTDETDQGATSRSSGCSRRTRRR